MFSVMTAFLPPTHIHLYLPALLSFWRRGFNSTASNDRMVELLGSLSEEHVAGACKEGSPEWQAVGIWSEDEWSFIVCKAFEVMGRCPCSTFYLSVAKLSEYEH